MVARPVLAVSLSPTAAAAAAPLTTVGEQWAAVQHMELETLQQVVKPGDTDSITRPLALQGRHQAKEEAATLAVAVLLFGGQLVGMEQHQVPVVVEPGTTPALRDSPAETAPLASASSPSLDYREGELLMPKGAVRA
jgi:hypothetical protein